MRWSGQSQRSDGQSERQGRVDVPDAACLVQRVKHWLYTPTRITSVVVVESGAIPRHLLPASRVFVFIDTTICTHIDLFPLRANRTPADDEISQGLTTTISRVSPLSSVCLFRIRSMRIPRVGPDPLAVNVQERCRRTSHDSCHQREDGTAPAVADRVVHCAATQAAGERESVRTHREKPRGGGKSTAQTHCRARTTETEEGEDERH